MGCYFASRLALSGLDVTLVDVSEQRVADINNHGVRVIDRDGDRRVPILATRADLLSTIPNLMLVFTKAMHTRAAVQSVERTIGPSTWVMTLQNGLGNAEQIAEIVPSDRILCGTTDIPADLHLPSTVELHGDGKIVFFDYLRAAPAILDNVQSMFEQAGFDCVRNPDVETAIWEKVAFNASMNALTAILRAPVGALNALPARGLIELILLEVEAVASDSGRTIDGGRLRQRVEIALREHGSHLPSMLQDVLAGRETEVESINGAIVRFGERHGTPTPVNRALLQLVQTQTAIALSKPEARP